MDANSVDLMRDTASQLRSAIERLKELGRRDLLGELDHAGQQELKELLKLLPQVSRDVREAKKVLEPAKTIGKRKQKDDPAPGQPKAKKNDAGGDGEGGFDGPTDQTQGLWEFTRPSFLEELVATFCGTPGNDTEFLCGVTGKRQATRAEEAALGLRLIAKGVGEYQQKNIEQAFRKLRSADIKEKCLEEFDTLTGIAQFSGEDMYRIVSASEKADDPTNLRTDVDMCQNLCQGFRALRFSLTLAELHFDPKASDAREKLLKEAFVAKKLSTKQPTAPAETGEPAVDEVTVPLTVDTVDKSSPDFKSFQNSYNDYKRGANRYLNAYRSLGSLLFLCPQLPFRYFNDPRLGKALQDAIQALHDQVFTRTNPTTRDKREAVHKSLVREAVKIMDSDSGRLTTVLGDLEDSWKRVTVEAHRAAEAKRAKAKKGGRGAGAAK